MALYSRDNARRSLIDTVAYRAMSQVATALGYVVMVRAMTEEDFGIFNLLYAFIPFVSTFASLGLDQTLRRYQPEYLRSGNTAAAAWLVRFVASARFGTNIVLLSLILLGWNYVAPLFKLTPYKAEFAFFCRPRPLALSSQHPATLAGFAHAPSVQRRLDGCFGRREARRVLSIRRGWDLSRWTERS